MSDEVQCPRCRQSLQIPQRLTCPSCNTSLVVEARLEAQVKPEQRIPFLVEEDKVVNALVVDSEGYICGRVLKTRYGEEEVFLDVYRVVEERAVVPDMDRLRQMLLKTLPKRILRPRGLKDLEERVRRDLNLHPLAPITDRELLEYAKLKGIPIPTRVHEHRDKKVVYSFSLEQVEAIGTSSLGTCVLLKEAVEAPVQEVGKRVPFKNTEQVRGKLSIDAAARIIGRASKVLLGTTLVLKIDLEDVVQRPVVDFSVLEGMEGASDIINRACASLGLDRSQLTADLLYDWARAEGIRLPIKREHRVEKVGELDVRWDELRKIGDVVLLNKRLEDYGVQLRQQPP